MDEVNQAEKENNVGGSTEYLNLQEGDNKMRVLSKPELCAYHYLPATKKNVPCYGMHRGCPFHEEDGQGPSVKWWAWVIDRLDDKIKLCKLPHKVFKQVAEYQINPEYSFEEFPMPYDITLKVKNVGTKEAEYTVIPARSNSDISEEEQNVFSKKSDVKSIVEKMKAKQAKVDGREYTPKEPTEPKERIIQTGGEEVVGGPHDGIEYPADEIDPADIKF